VPLHDSGEAGGQVYYVMPYIEGESLRDRLTRERQLPIDEALRVAREMADALDYAHQHGVVHRDIKPENILLHGGHAQVADFGIALAASQSTGGNRMTETGMSLGTPHYMSPEQAMGEREITGRADIYALGAVLYEMLTGEPPFTGATAQAIFARVLTEEPRGLTIQRKTIPPHIEAVVLQALAKLPADRFATAAEFAKALGDPTFHTTGYGPHGTVALRGRGSRVASREVLVAVGVAVLFAALAAWGWFRPTPPAPVSRFGLAFPEGQEPVAVVEITPDESKLVYIGPGEGGPPRLWVKERASDNATPLAGTEDPGPFAISPDSRWVAFNSRGGIKKIPLAGGPVTILSDSAFGFAAGVAWLDDGTIIYSDAQAGLARVSSSGGPFTSVYLPDSARFVPVFPSSLPASRGVLFTACAGPQCTPPALWVLDLATGKGKELVPGALRGWYLPSGHLIYVDNAGRMFAAPFDLDALAFEGTPVPVMDDVTILFGVYPNLSVSTAGTLVMQSSRSAANDRGTYTLVAVDRDGLRREVDSTWRFDVTRAGGNVGIALSPDGRNLAIGLNTRSGDDIWIKRLPDGALSRLTLDSAPEARPRWSPDGRWVSYVVDADSIFRRRADGIGNSERLHTIGNLNEGIWSPDGGWFVVRVGGQTEGTAVRDIYGRRAADSAFVPLIADPKYNETSPAISPDGRWITYVSNETGRPEVYVRPFPGVDEGKWQVSVAGGQAPLWARSGRELFYVDARRSMMVVAVPPGATFAPGTPRKLFQLEPTDYLGEVENYTPFEITPDGRHFLMLRLRMLAPGAEGRFLYVENWFTELKAAVGTQ
jgi:hypothetical protein